jgi:hypothetical protein
MKFNIFLASVLIALGSTLCAVVAIAINPDIFTNFFSNSPVKLFYDVEHYANLVINPVCNAFYPLWPWIISKFAKPESVKDAALNFRVLGSSLSLISIPLLLLLLKQNIRNYKIAIIVTALYAMSPISIFRMIGYTEGIFSVLSLIFLILLTKIKITSQISIKSILVLASVFLSSFLLSLTRPFLIQVIFASVSALVSILLISKIQDNTNFPKYFKTYGTATLTICLGALLGYGIYGYYCFESRGDFFAPFQDQKLWGKQLGFYPQLFLIPLTFADFTSIYLPLIALGMAWLIYISTNIKKLIFLIPNLWQWILLFSYPPAFLAFYGFELKTVNFSNNTTNLKKINLTPSAKSIFTSYVFWFCLYFAFIHSVIIVFSDQKLTSLRRLIFGTPYFFVAIAYLAQCFPYRKVSKLLLWILGISSIWLVQYWLDYANHVWIG